MSFNQAIGLVLVATLLFWVALEVALRRAIRRMDLLAERLSRREAAEQHGDAVPADAARAERGTPDLGPRA